jgi:hypothetical protein
LSREENRGRRTNRQTKREAILLLVTLNNRNKDEDERTPSIQPINPHHVLEKADGSDDDLNDDIPDLVNDVDDNDREDAEESAEAELSKLSPEDPISQAD